MGQAFPFYWLGLGARSAMLPAEMAAAEIGDSWRTVEMFAVLGVWAVIGMLLAPILLRRMARRQSGSTVAAVRRAHHGQGLLTVAESGDVVHNRIAMLRAERGVSRRELADALGVHYQTIGYLERGEFSPSLHLALRIAAYFDVPVEIVFSLKPFKRLGE